MSAAWVAASVRARALLARTTGTDGAKELASAATWEDARHLLAGTPAGRGLVTDADRATARLATANATAWQLRVLAGWCPPDGTGLVRLATAPIEIANIEHHLAHLEGSPPTGAARLGSLATVWPRVARTTSAEEVRDVLRRSIWSDPGAGDRASIAIGLRIAWARRVARVEPIGRDWAQGASALLVARERFGFRRGVTSVAGVELDRLIGRRWRAATTISDLADRLPDEASWVLAGIDEPSDLWRSEAALIHRIATDARPIAMSGRPGRTTVAAVLALLVVDLWRVTSAIEAAGRGPVALGVFDALAS